MPEDKPKFTLWMGDNWPGPYVVTFLRNKDKVLRTIVVNGVRNPAEAVLVAVAQYPDGEEERTGVSVVIGHVAEASHYMDALAEHRKLYPPIGLPGE